MEINNECAAVITGAASGLGLATARLLANRGVRVAIFDLNEDMGQAAAAELGGVFARVDVTDDESVADGFEFVRKKHGQERILINCAGGGKGGRTVRRDKDTGLVKAHSMADFEWTVRLNLIGSFRCIAAAASGMLTVDRLPGGERGVIVNTASVAAQDGQIGQIAYSASKAALAGMTLTLARDLSSEGIRVNTILPGIFETPLMRGVPQPVLDKLAADVPFPKRLGDANEFGSLALECVRNGYLNGETIRLDGAIRMAPR
ncbi:MAG: 3-hydroxy-2-methylbutyryl-CoA dehydrogenase [Erythrobacter sp.]|nr:3-hydroxy-2-methylbutyryl-CoA dehydrogenase [Erythrobacter sp.]|tara:strand:+ start:277 stop:1059 length:783 start_codon:yes stop_codon:yes gene_type:complete